MLSKRLKSLTKYIDKNDNLIDIGCDHALLDIYLIKNKIVNKMIASDVHENALNAGIKNIELNNLSKKIDTRLGNGLDVLTKDDKVDTVLISGMGSSTIIDIINNKYTKHIKKFIIQSNNDYYLLRKEFINHGYKIIDEEYLIDKNKEYINIIFVKGSSNYTDDELLYGPILIKDRNYLTSMINKEKIILSKIPNSKIILRFKHKYIIKKTNKYLQMT